MLNTDHPNNITRNSWSQCYPPFQPKMVGRSHVKYNFNQVKLWLKVLVPVEHNLIAPVFVFTNISSQELPPKTKKLEWQQNILNRHLITSALYSFVVTIA